MTGGESKATNNLDPILKKVEGQVVMTDQKLVENIDLSMNLPLPDWDKYWKLDELARVKQKKGILGFFKNKPLPATTLNELRHDAEIRPGITQVRIQTLEEKYKGDRALAMLNALCRARMVARSIDIQEVIASLKLSTKEAGTVLISDGISIFNCFAFFEIYFGYLGKLKRLQANTFKRAQMDPKFKPKRNGLANAFNICDVLLDEKARSVKQLNRIKNLLKSSNLYTPILLSHIKSAAKKVESRDFTVPCGPATAKEIFAHTLTLVEMFARIPMLFPLVESIYKLLPESDLPFTLRKRSIVNSKLFTELNIAIQADDTEKKRNLGRKIHLGVKGDLIRLGKSQVKQGFEANPYISIGRVAIMTFGLYNQEEQEKILNESLRALKLLLELDKSKTGIYKNAAQSMIKKISSLKPEN